MLKCDVLLSILLVLIGGPAGAQDFRREFRPEFDVYVSEGSRVRLDFKDTFNEALNTSFSQGVFGYFAEFALRPVFRRELRQNPDVFRRRFLTLNAGYERITSIANGKASWENRTVVELTARYPLPRGFVLIDRNRQEFRMVEGQNVSVRYRNRLWVEHDLRFKAFAFTPYVYDEIYFDTRYHAWSKNRLVAGLQVPVANKFVLEPYLLRQINYRGSPRHTQALGFKVSAFF